MAMSLDASLVKLWFGNATQSQVYGKIGQMRIELVIFDIAGTTVEDLNGVGGCLKAALEAEGVLSNADEINAQMGIPKPLAIGALLKLAGEPEDDRRISAIHADFQRRMIDFYQTSPDVREVAGAAEVFRTLRSRGIKVGLDTGFDRSIVDVILGRLGWNDDLLDASVTSDEVSRGRPFPDLVFEMMRRTSVDNVKAIAKVGDTPSDLQEGTAAGCGLVIGVTDGTHSRELLELHPHTHLVKSVRDVPAVLC